MTINGKYYTEPEAVAYIMQLEAAVRRYEDENRRLMEQLDEIGNEYNMQVSTIGWLENKNAELEAERASLIKQLDKDIEEYSKSVYGDLYKGMQAGYMVLRSRLLREDKCPCYESGHWYLGDDAGTCNGTKEREACNCKGDKEKCDYYKNSNR